MNNVDHDQINDNSGNVNTGSGDQKNIRVEGDHNSVVENQLNNKGAIQQFFIENQYITEPNKQPNSPDLCAIHFQIGLQSLEQLNYSKARKYLTIALDEQKEIHRLVHEKTARIYDCLGVIYRELGQYDKAEKFIKRAIRIRGDN